MLSNQAETDRKRDFMRFELSEISKAKPYHCEDEELSQKLDLLQHSEKIYQNLFQVYELMYDSTPCALDGIGQKSSFSARNQ